MPIVAPGQLGRHEKAQIIDRRAGEFDLAPVEDDLLDLIVEPNGSEISSSSKVADGYFEPDQTVPAVRPFPGHRNLRLITLNGLTGMLDEICRRVPRLGAEIAGHQ